MTNDYLAEACNELRKALSDTLAPDPAEVERLFTIACNALKRASQQEMGELVAALLRAREIREADPTSYAAATSLEHFMDEFTRVETELLVKAGFSRPTAEYVMEEAGKLHGYLRSASPEPREIETQLVAVRDATCWTARALHERRELLESQSRLRARLNRAFGVLAGIGLVGVNISTIAATGGLSAIGVALSTIAGGRLIERGFPDA